MNQKLNNLKVNQVEITASIQSDGKKIHENMLGSASITLKDDSGEYLVLSGFTIWRSKKDKERYNVTPPSSRTFKFCMGNLLARIKDLIIKEYEDSLIPIID